MTDGPNRQMTAVLDMVVGQMKGRPPTSEWSLEELRESYHGPFTRFWNAGALPVALVQEISLPGGAGPVAARLYDPFPARPDPQPGLLYLHGGGWTMGTLETHDGVCRRLALTANLRLIALDYRLAPEYPYPAGLEDCAAALEYLMTDGNSIGIDPCRLALAGDSAGGNLTLATLLLRKSRGGKMPAAAAPIYGAFSMRDDTGSALQFGDEYHLLPAKGISRYWEWYLSRPHEAGSDPLVEPLYGDLGGLPPMLLTAGACDPLADDSRDLASALREAGVTCRLVIWPGLTHGVLHMVRMVDDIVVGIERIGDFLRGELG